jgi:ABC-type transport system substrate-binding protein/DNA-binding SARP family transcriptional activator
MEFSVLGPLEAWHSGVEIPLGSRKQRVLLAILLLRANEVVPSDVLIDELWGEHPPPSAAHTLHVYVSRLRKALRVDGAADVLITFPGGYLLRVEFGQLDLQRFERLVEDGRRALAAGSPERAAEKLRSADALWRGRALADLALEAFARVDAERLEEQRLTAREDRIEAELALGRHAALVPELETLVAQHPLRERLRAQLMLTLHRCGRQADALRVYRDAREYLVEELGLEPSKRLRQLEQAILCQDDALELPSSPPVATSVFAGERGSDGNHRDVAQVEDVPERTVVAAESPRTSPLSRARRSRGHVVLAAAAVVLLVAAVFTGAFALRSRSARAPVAIHGNAVVFVDRATGRVASQVQTRGRPAGLAVGAGGLWVTDAVAGEVLKLDRRTRRVVDRIPVGGAPSDVAVGGGGVWVVDAENRSVAELEPTAGTVVARVRVGNEPSAIAYGEGAFWVADATDGTLTRIDPSRARVVRVIRVGQPLSDVVVGLGGVWTTSAASGLLFRIDPGTSEVVQSVSVGNWPTSLALAGGALWVTNAPDRTITRIEPNGIVRKVNNVDPVALAPSDGVLWVAEARRRELIAVDPRTRAVGRSIAVGALPAEIAPLGRMLALVTSGPAAAHRGGTLRLVASQALDSIDPRASWSAIGWQLLSLAYDGLVTYARSAGPAGARVVPDLAIAVPTPQEGGRVFSFHLRRGVRYSNGSPVRPQDFRKALESEYAHSRGLAALGVPLVGAERCRLAARRCDLSRGVAVDEAAGTITFRLSKPDPAFLYKLALPFGAAVPAGSPPGEHRRGPLPGTGPYRIDRYIPGREVVFVRNPYFRQPSADRPLGFPDRIRVALGIDAAHQVAAVTSGRADVMADAPPARDLSTIVRRFPSQAHPYALPKVLAMFLNTRLAPFDRLRARRALNFAVDRSVVVRLAGGQRFAQGTCQILPAGFPGYRPFCPYTSSASAAGLWRAPDLARARSLVDGSGTAGTSVRVSTPADDPLKLATGRYLVRLLDRLGYRARLRVYPGLHRYYERVALAGEHSQVGVFGWQADYETGSAFFRPLFTCAAYQPHTPFMMNKAGFCHRGIDAAIARATVLEAANPAAANAAWERVDRRITLAAPWVPLVDLRGVDFVARRVGNYGRNPVFGILLDQLWVR